MLEPEAVDGNRPFTMKAHWIGEKNPHFPSAFVTSLHQWSTFFSLFLANNNDDDDDDLAFSISLEAIWRWWHTAKRESLNFCDSCTWLSGEEVGFYPLALSSLY